MATTAAATTTTNTTPQPSWRLFGSCLVALFLSRLTTAQSQECGLYLAESSSSTPEDPKLGMFAGVDLPAETLVSPPEAAIHTFNIMAHSLDEDSVTEEDYQKYPRAAKAVELFEQWIWVAEASGGAFELPFPQKALSVLAGAGALVGYHPRLINTKWNHSAAYFRPSIGETPGKAHPGRGAYSPFYNVGLVSTIDIPAGHEIFMDYGDSWEGGQESPSSEKLNTEDHERMDQVVDSMLEFMEKYEQELTPESKREIYNFLVHDVITAAAGEVKGKLVAGMLPDNPDDLQLVKEAGGSVLYRNPNVLQPLSWLQENGMCMDNIEPGASTIPNAGRGAFARRPIPKGERISPVPLAHIADKSTMNMYKLERTEDGDFYRLDDTVIGQQLLLNYCFGHPKSSLLLFPAGAVVNFVNHSSRKANAKLVWSDHPFHQGRWFDVPPEELVSNHDLGLIMEIVATKNIKPGEEIFLDYGRSWQLKWDNHVKEWKKKSKTSKWPVRSVEVNEEYRTRPHKTMEEQHENPIPEGLQLKCFLVLQPVEEGEDGFDAVKYAGYDNIKRWTNPEKGSAFETRHMFGCSVVDRQAFVEDSVPKYTYTISYQTHRNKNVVLDVPHDALVFVDAPEAGDQFTEDPFRHYIEIPDDVFPQGAWRDLDKVRPIEY